MVEEGIFLGLDLGLKNSALTIYYTKLNHIAILKGVWNDPFQGSVLQNIERLMKFNVIRIIVEDAILYAAGVNPHLIRIKEMIAVLEDRYKDLIYKIHPSKWKRDITGENQKPCHKDVLKHLEARNIEIAVIYGYGALENMTQDELDSICICIKGIDYYYDEKEENISN